MPPKEVSKKVDPAAKKKAQIDAKLRKKLGEGAVSEALPDPKFWYRTGNPALDVAISGKVGMGFPAGRICEIYGNENVGKTTLGATVMREAQKAGALAYMIDTESTFRTSRAKTLGVDMEHFTYLHLGYMEPILDGIDSIITDAGDQKIVVFWDTIAGTPSQAERGRAIGEMPLGLHARALSQGFRKFATKLAHTSVLVLCCNQLKVGDVTNRFATERDRDSTLGGSAIRFHADVRIKMTFQKTSYDKDKKPIGFLVTAKVVKSKGGPDQVKCKLVFRREGGGRFDVPLSVLHTLALWEGFSIENVKIPCGDEKITVGTFVNRYKTDAKFVAEQHRRLEAAYIRENKRNEG